MLTGIITNVLNNIRLPFMDKNTFAKHKVWNHIPCTVLPLKIHHLVFLKSVSSSFKLMDKKQVFHYINNLGFTFIIDKGSSIKPLPPSLKQRITDQCLQEEH